MPACGSRTSRSPPLPHCDQHSQRRPDTRAPLLPYRHAAAVGADPEAGRVLRRSCRVPVDEVEPHATARSKECSPPRLVVRNHGKRPRTDRHEHSVARDPFDQSGCEVSARCASRGSRRCRRSAVTPKPPPGAAEVRVGAGGRRSTRCMTGHDKVAISGSKEVS